MDRHLEIYIFSSLKQISENGEDSFRNIVSYQIQFCPLSVSN